VKRLLLALGILGTLIIAGNPPAARAGAYPPLADMARVKLWTGSDCGSSSGCQLVERNNITNETRVAAIGALNAYTMTKGYAPPYLNAYTVFVPGHNYSSNAWIGYFEGNQANMTMYARQPCPTPGAFHYSGQVSFWESGNYPGTTAPRDVGTLTIQSGCQTQMAPLG